MQFLSEPSSSMLRRNKPAQSQMGFSMIEVLVAMLIISLGLLGIGGITAATFGYNKTAQIRLTGLTLVNDYADRARLNVFGYDRGDYAVALADDVPSTEDVATAKAALTIDQADPATAAQNVATYDRSLFQRTVADRLPQGRTIVISNPSADARDLDVWLLWQEPTTAVGDALFSAGQFNCPDSLSDEEKLVYSCMYFKVGL